MKKKFLILLTVIMILLLFGVMNASAEIVENGDCGSHVSYTLDNNGTLTISGTGAMKDYYDTRYRSPFYDNSSIKTVVIENGVTCIGNYAFYGCYGLTNITIPNSVTSIGSSAFYHCSGLTSITIPDSVTSIGEEAFQGCNGLESAYFSNLEAYLNISYGGYVANPMRYANKLYLNGKRLTGSIEISNTVTKIPECAFKNCDAIKSVTIPNSVTSIGYEAFYGCNGLTSITIPDSVTTIGDMAFYNCSGLTSITIPDSVTSIDDYVFDGCNGLTSITIPNSVTSIGSSAFYGCNSLTSITIPNSVTSIGYEAFYGCYGLTSITIPDSVTSIGGYAFEDCSRLTTVNYNATNCTAMGSRDHFLNGVYAVFKGCSTLTTVNIGNNVTNIPSCAFYGCSGLTSMTIPDNVASIGDNAFCGCRGLENISIPEMVKAINENTFYGCSNLKKIFIPKATIEIEKSAFEGCSALKTVEYSGSQADWDDMYIGSGNECLTNAKLTFVKPATYTITTSARYGTITPDKTSAVTGDTISFTVAPSAGYILTDVSVKVNNGDVSVTSNGNSYSFTMPNKNVTITATFKKEPEMVTVSFDTNEGILTGESTVKVEKGTALSESNIPTAAKDGHTFAGWILNGKTFSLNTPIAEEITLTALWIENGIQKTAVQTLPEFNDMLDFEKSAGENENTIFTVTKKSDAEIPEPVVFAVHFGTDGSLQSIDKFDFTKSGDTYTAIVDKQTGDYKIFVWTKNMQPITEAEKVDL